VGIDVPLDIAVRLAGRASHQSRELVPLTLCGSPPASPLPPYGNVLLDVLAGDSALAVHGHLAEEAWRIVTPVLDAWAAGVVPLGEYAAGSNGPPSLIDATRHAA